MIAGIPCDPADYENDYHVHAHLNIRVDGRLTLPPADVGIRPGCHYWIHTHQPYGVIHIEAPTGGAYTLGQLFDIWGKKLSATQVGDDVVGPGHSLFVFVDRERSEVADPRGIPLDDLHAIELQIGTAPLDPLPYAFPADLQ